MSNQSPKQINWIKQKIKQYNNDIFDITSKYQLKYQFKDNPTNPQHRFWNNEGDVFKHAYMQADLSFKFGSPIASIPGYYHEIEGTLKKQPWHEKNMDLWNNKIGRKIGRDVKAELMGKRKLSQQEIDNAIAEKVMQKMKNGELITSPDDPRARTIMEKIKDNLKTPQNFKSQNLSSENTGLSNSASVSNQLIQIPSATQSANDAFLQQMSLLGQLGQTTSVGGSVMGLISPFISPLLGFATMGLGTIFAGLTSGIGATLSTSAQIVGFGFHTGGTVPGQGEVLTVLKGGETVRTKPQEQDLQQHFKNFAPTVCGGNQNQQEQYPKEKQPQKPLHQRVTKDDESFLLNLVLDAIDRNRMGLRTKMQGVRCS